MAALSPHFTLQEMISSDTAVKKGFPNIPDDLECMNLVRLCADLLEPIREIIGNPMHINSGFRADRVNAAVGGMQYPPSAHLFGRAADFVVPGMDLSTAWDKIKNENLPFDQLIWETNRFGSQWIHASVPEYGIKPRRIVLYLQKRENRKYLG